MNTETDDEIELARVKELRLCPCGKYKSAWQFCCESCWRFLSRELRHRVQDEKTAGCLSPQTLTEAKTVIAERVDELKAALATGNYEDRKLGEPDRDRHFRLKFLVDRGVKLSDEDFYEIMEAKRAKTQGYFSQYREKDRELVTNVLAKAVKVVGGMK